MVLNLEANLDSKLSPLDDAELLYPDELVPVLWMLSRRVGGVGKIDIGGGGGRALLGGCRTGGCEEGCKDGCEGGGGGGWEGRLCNGGGGGGARVGSRPEFICV